MDKQMVDFQFIICYCTAGTTDIKEQAPGLRFEFKKFRPSTGLKLEANLSVEQVDNIAVSLVACLSSLQIDHNR